MTLLPVLAALLLLLAPPAPAAGPPPSAAHPYSLTTSLPASGDDLRATHGWEVPTFRVDRRADGPGGTSRAPFGPVRPPPASAARAARPAPEGTRPLSERLPYQATAPPAFP